VISLWMGFRERTMPRKTSGGSTSTGVDGGEKMYPSAVE